MVGLGIVHSIYLCSVYMIYVSVCMLQACATKLSWEAVSLYKNKMQKKLDVNIGEGLKGE